MTADVAVTIEGAAHDYTVSGDAMRWTPAVEREWLTWADIPGLVRGMPEMTP